MDSFLLFFPLSLSANIMCEALLAFDFGCTILEPKYLTAYLADGRVWISLLNEQEMEDERQAGSLDVTIPEGSLTLAVVDVSRRENSDLFAIFLAERLISKYQGSVDWNGIHYWEELYQGLQRWREDHPETRVSLANVADSKSGAKG
jgi:hypothetical protein